MYNEIAEILNARWLIHHDTVLGYIPSLLSFINGGKIIAADANAKPDSKKLPYVISKASSINLAAANDDMVDRWDLMNGNVPEMSIAVIPIQGVMRSSDTMPLARYVQMAEQNTNIIGILFLINTPGGMVFYTDICSSVIKSVTKPKIGYVLGTCCSAGMWLASGMDRIFVSSELDKLGSIGVMTNIMNINSMLKDKLGITIEDIYATKSDKKNSMWREFLSGNNKPIIDDLDFTNEIFHKTIKANMGIAENSPVFSGDTYFAKEAISLGLAHEINTIDNAVEYLLTQGYKSQFKNNSKF